MLWLQEEIPVKAEATGVRQREEEAAVAEGTALNGVCWASVGAGTVVLQEAEGYFVLKELMFHIEALFLYNIQSLMHF